ncbi:class I SAM-dependent methyltransferase [Streptomyces sp. NPDC005438]|uniref:class I SAM-dependent methyltransferase n=1 Tax=Streptomyces sp. NPDC005438 TaxID=3156880 RepID=UPI0033A95371
MTTTDLWHHYGRTRAGRDRSVPAAFHWTWSQDGGPGPEVLGDLRGRVVGDLGAGAARHAAYLATRHQPDRVVAVDASPAQCAMAGDLYGRHTPRLRVLRSDAVEHLHASPDTYDVLYSVFGAVDFTDPRKLLPAANAALRPRGRLVFSTLAHHLTGTPARWDVVASEIPARTPDREPAVLRRWVLQQPLWTELLDRAGFVDADVVVLPPVAEGPRAASTLLVTAFRPLP